MVKFSQKIEREVKVGDRFRHSGSATIYTVAYVDNMFVVIWRDKKCELGITEYTQATAQRNFNDRTWILLEEQN
ncbi:hypothetical protein SAMN05518847_102406 [Paenibacillus sp. OV219]|nr:hypothetical protein SAMN05518847_102406 [Paenibacillus sp. OV219]